MEDELQQFHTILSLLEQGNDSAMEFFYERYGKLLSSASRSIVSSSLAEEVVNDVLVYVWKNASKLKEVKSPKNWLYRVTVNRAKNAVRAEKIFDEIGDETTIDKRLEKVESDDEFFSLISTLDENERMIMIFRFVEDMSFREIAKEVKKPLAGVTTTYYRALKKIKSKKI